MTIRILLADYQASMRRSLRALIELQPGMEVVAETGDGQTALRLVGKIKPDVVLMDTNMPGLTGVDAARQMIPLSPETRILALSMHANREFVDEMIKAGVAGYLLKDQAFEELVRGIRTVVENRIYLCPGIEEQAPRQSG